jgi:hypothetical protein
MTILSPQQRVSIGTAGTPLVPIIDPETHQAYLIIDLQIRSWLTSIPVGPQSGREDQKQGPTPTPPRLDGDRRVVALYPDTPPSARVT